MDIEKVVEEFWGQGYTIVDDALEPELFERLERASWNVWDKVRSGEVDPWGKGPDAGSIFGLLAPEFGEPVFGEHFLSPSLLRYVHEFLGTELRLGYVHLRNSAGEYDTGWHRDVAVSAEMAYDEEIALLNRPMQAMRWQTAFTDDPCLWLIPYSQRRFRTQEEHRALYEDRKMNLTGQVNLFLQRGQTLIWDGNTIHRGRKPADMKERLVMTGGLRKYYPDEPKEEKIDERFRWRLADNVGEALPDQVRLWWERWRALQPDEQPAVAP